MEALEVEYVAKSETRGQLLLKKINGTYMEKRNDVVNHENNMASLANELSF